MDKTSAEVWIDRGLSDRGQISRADERDRAWALVLRLAARVAGTAPERLRLEREPGGRPVVRGAAVHVSVSHARGVVAVAAGLAGPIGVDAEVVREFATGPLARRWFPGSEAAWVEGCDPGERAAAFLWLWTRKEALGKAMGRGLAGGAGLAREVGLPERWPPTVATAGAAASDDVRLGRVPGGGFAAANWFHRGLMLAVAVEGAAAEGTVVRIRPPGDD